MTGSFGVNYKFNKHRSITVSLNNDKLSLHQEAVGKLYVSEF